MSSRSPGGADVNILPIEFFIVACRPTFALFHTFIIVTNYIDISRKMNYTGIDNLDTFGTIICVYELILSEEQWSCTVIMRPNDLGLGFESHRRYIFLVF